MTGIDERAAVSGGPGAIVLSRVRVEADRGLVLDVPALRLTERRVAVIGPNGAGKSTLLRLLNGLVRPATGTVTVDGLDTVRDGDAVRRRVGFVFADAEAQIVFPVVIDDLAFGLRNRGHSAREARAAGLDILGRYGLAPLAERSVHTLSGGEKGLVALLGVLVTDPEIVMLDEPTTTLDLRNRNRVRAALDALPQRTVIATHDLDLAAACDRALVVADGRVVADGEPEAAIALYRERYG